MKELWNVLDYKMKYTHTHTDDVDQNNFQPAVTKSWNSDWAVKVLKTVSVVTCYNYKWYLINQREYAW